MVGDRPSEDGLDGAARLLASAAARLGAAAADLALPPSLRLTEWQRTTVSALAESLLSAAEDELRSAVLARLSGDGLEAARAALGSARVEIAGPIIAGRSAVAAPPLLPVLLRRAEEHRLHRAAAGEQGLLVALAGDEDRELAAEAMALLVAEAGRLDAFQEPVMARHELSAELEHAMLWTVAAALRSYLVRRQNISAAQADEALAGAAASLLTAYDEGETFDARCMKLVRGLRAKGRLDGGFAARAVTGGTLTLAVAALAGQAQLSLEAAWQLLLEKEGAPLLLRAAGLGRDDAGALLVALQWGDIAGQLDLFDGIDAADAHRLLTLWRADPAYRVAITELAA